MKLCYNYSILQKVGDLTNEDKFWQEQRKINGGMH